MPTLTHQGLHLSRMGCSDDHLSPLLSLHGHHFWCDHQKSYQWIGAFPDIRLTLGKTNKAGNRRALILHRVFTQSGPVAAYHESHKPTEAVWKRIFSGCC